MKHGSQVWAQHPHVRTGAELTFGERAADVLKKQFGTWTLLGIVAAFIVFWMTLAYDPGELRLNLILSCMAAVQGIILQISANRGDRNSAEVAIGTHENTERIAVLLAENTSLTRLVKVQTDLLEEIHRHVSATVPAAGAFPPPGDAS